MVEASIKIAIGQKPDLKLKWNKGAAIRYLRTETGTIKEITGIENAKKVSGVKQVSIVHSIGEQIGEIKSSVDRAGFVIAQSEDATKAIAVAEEAIRAIDIVVTEEM